MFQVHAGMGQERLGRLFRRGRDCGDEACGAPAETSAEDRVRIVSLADLGRGRMRGEDHGIACG